MSAIGVGDFVEYIQDSIMPLPGIAHLTLGAVYQVREMANGPNRHGVNVDGLRLVGIANPRAGCGREYAYAVERFRPIYRPKADFLESLLTPADAPSEREGVEA